MATVTEPVEVEGGPTEMLADITADEFFAMVDAGIFTYRRVFLWGGRILEKMAKTVSHALTSVFIGEAVRKVLPDNWWIWPENPVRLDARHAPLPDVTVVRGPLERFGKENRHPDARDVGLIIEVAVTSLPRDLGERAEKFARAMVPIYWVADVQGHQIIEHRRPRVLDGVGSYESVKSYGLSDSIMLELDSRVLGPIPIAEMLH